MAQVPIPCSPVTSNVLLYRNNFIDVASPFIPLRSKLRVFNDSLSEGCEGNNLASLIYMWGRGVSGMLWIPGSAGEIETPVVQQFLL